jgi:hypothetical protein
MKRPAISAVLQATRAAARCARILLEDSRSWLLSRLDTKATWVWLSKIRDSFLSKATTAFSVATFGLANLAEPLGRVGVDLWQLRLLFPGSMLFLIGYLIVAIRMPLEFQGSRSLDEIVDRMFRVHTYSFYRSRVKMTEAMLDRWKKGGEPCWLRGPLEIAKEEVAGAAKVTEDKWHEPARGLYYADVVLRQHDRRIDRAAALVCLGLGLVLLLIPTIVSVFRAVGGFIPNDIQRAL